MDKITVEFTDSLLYDRLRTLSVEYSAPAELLANVAIKRVINDADFVRSFCIGKIEWE